MTLPQPDLFFSPETLSLNSVPESSNKTDISDRILSIKEKEKLLGVLENHIATCQRCQLSESRTKTVPGEGNADTDLMFIGEGPGRQEDLTGRPFVGRAGEFLNRVIEQGLRVSRSQVYIANIVKCRATVDLAFEKDRPPEPDETEACSHFLLEQIRVIQPKVIVALGGPATKFLLKTSVGITRLRGKWAEFEGIPVLPVYHPSYILRNGGDKSPLRKELWEDMQLVMKRLGWKI